MLPLFAAISHMLIANPGLVTKNWRRKRGRRYFVGICAFSATVRRRYLNFDGMSARCRCSFLADGSYGSCKFDARPGYALLGQNSLTEKQAELTATDKIKGEASGMLNNPGPDLKTGPESLR